jgi:RNA polymerase sigma factor (sigma-70 family)
VDATDHELWDSAELGNSRAFGALFERHRDRIYRKLLRSAPANEAEDLTAVVFLELWRRRTSVRFVDGSLHPWLLVTATNVARNSNRGRRRYARLLAALPPPEPSPDFSDEADSTMDAARATTALHAALGSLPAIDRTLISLIALDDLPLATAAEVLGLSYGAAKTRLSRARQKLRASHPDFDISEVT